MSNLEKLKTLLIDVFLIDPSEWHMNLKREEIDSWDSLGVVSLEVGIKETFKTQLTPQEAGSLKTVQDIVTMLSSKGIDFSS